MKVLVLGKKGQMARSLKEKSKNDKNNTYNFIGKNVFQKPKKTHIDRLIEKYDPNLIINLLAITNVDFCEKNKKIAFNVNYLLVKKLVSICKKRNIFFFQISTDYVYFRNLNKVIYEKDKPNPRNYYGITKLDAENEIRLLKFFIILRTSTIFSGYSQSNFYSQICKKIELKKNFFVPDFLISNPTFSDHLSLVILKIINNKNIKKLSGVYNYVDKPYISRFKLARFIAKRKYKNDLNLIKKLNISNYFPLAKRGKFSILNCDKINKTFGIKQFNWKKSYLFE